MIENLRGLFTLLSTTETLKTKLPTGNVSHGDQHAEMSRSSGALSDIARAKETGLCRRENQGETSQDYTRTIFVNTTRQFD